MIHIYTFCNQTLVGKKQNSSASFLCENLFKLNFKIEEVCTFCNSYDYQNLTFKNKDIYFLLMQKSSNVLNSALASLSCCELGENMLLKEVILNNYKFGNKPLDKDAELEWLIPQIAIPITNPNGKVQGYSIKIGEAHIFVLPNNFEEFKCIYNDCLLDYIEQNFSVEYKSETYKTFGLSEQNLNEILKDQIKNKDKVFISIFSRGLDNDIVIKAKSDNVKFEEYRRAIFVKLENYIYSVQDLSMPLTLEKQLHDTNTSIAVVGDLSIKFLMKNLTDKTLQSNLMLSACLPNDSSKIKYGISKQTITKFGEVSPEVAYEIAVSLLDKTNCELVVSSLVCLDGQDRGTTYIAIGNKAKIDIYKNCFAGSNEEILNNLSATTMFYLIKKLKTRDFKTI